MSWVDTEKWTCNECNRTVHMRDPKQLRAEQKRHWKAHRAADRMGLKLDSVKEDKG